MEVWIYYGFSDAIVNSIVWISLFFSVISSVDYYYYLKLFENGSPSAVKKNLVSRGRL
jgi:hypothetical protein